MLNLQGDVREHVAALRRRRRAQSRLVKRVETSSGIAGLVIPGGESTTLSMLLTSTGLFEAVSAKIADGLPVFGTCAGLVLLAGEVLDGRPDQRSFGALSRRGAAQWLRPSGAVVRRAPCEFGEGPPLPVVFIRAPMVVSVGPGGRRAVLT